MNVLRRGQPAQDVFRGHVMSEQQDLLVQPEEAALWELREREGGTETVFCQSRSCASLLLLLLLLLWGFGSFLFEQEVSNTAGILQMTGS